MVRIGDLIASSALPVLQIVLLCSVGALARRKDWLPAAGSKSLGKLIYHLFLPALIISSLAVSVTRGELIEWFALPVSVLFSVFFGMVAGYLVAPLVKVPKEIRPHFICCCGIGNLGNMPLVLVPAIARQSPDFTESDAEKGVAYVFVGMFAIVIAQFSVAYNMLKPATPLVETPPESGDPHAEHDTSPMPPIHDISFKDLQDGNRASSSTQPSELALDHNTASPVSTPHSRAELALGTTSSTTGSGHDEASFTVHTNPHAFQPPPPDDSSVELTVQPLRLHRSASWHAREALKPSMRPHDDSPEARDQEGRSASIELEGVRQAPVHGQPCRMHHPDDLSETEASDKHTCASGGFSSIRPLLRDLSSKSGPLIRNVSSGVNKVKESPAYQTIRRRLKPVTQLFTPPVWSIVVGIGIACLPAVRDQFFVVDDEDGACEGTDVEEERPPLAFLGQALIRLGAAMIPCLMLNLGASLSKGPGEGNVPAIVLIAVVGVRLVLLPVIGAAFVLGTKELGLWSPPDDMFTMVLLLHHAMPTALNMHVVAGLHQNHEKEVAAMLFWQYVACIITVPLCVGVFLVLVL